MPDSLVPRLDNSNAAALGALIQCNTRLHGVSLEGNHLTEEGLLRLADALRRVT